ncbi:Utp14 protein [Giardia muris]|uniref:Utp14 protein n=1 Tax=Giardia muris TaxID=5742 RepID=A0A4Z1T2M5_GIAMU|nr:Utp14 protein [Giardia muris]|eukprot:TNJ26829.1 Utp14 protein [Giardia muris]
MTDSSSRASSRSASFSSSSDDETTGLLLRKMLPQEDEVKHSNLSGFIRDLMTMTDDNDLVARLANQYGLKSSDPVDVSNTAVSTTQRLARERRLVQKQVFGDLDKWKPVIEAQTGPDVYLKYHRDTDTSTLQSIKQPQNDEITAALTEAGLIFTPPSLDLESQAVTQQEMTRSNAEVARLRALIHYNERKLRAWSKIKSKSFRRIHNREKRLQALEQRQKAKNRHAAIDAHPVMEFDDSLDDELVDQLDTKYSMATQGMTRFQREQARLEPQLQDDEIPDYDPEAKEDTQGVMGLAFMRKALRKQQEFRQNLEELNTMFDEESKEENAKPTQAAPKPSVGLMGRQILGLPVEPQDGSASNGDDADAEPLKEEADEEHPVQNATDPFKPKVIIRPTRRQRRPLTQENPFLRKALHKDEVKEPPSTFTGEIDTTTLPEAPTETALATMFASNEQNDEFLAEKGAMIMNNVRADGEDQDTFLHGWGSWFGEGMSDRKKRQISFKQMARRVALAAELSEKMKLRKDLALSHVALNEARTKEATEMFSAKGIYGVSDVDYAAYLTTAVGPEWQSVTGFYGSIQRNAASTKGQIITPAILPQEYQKQLDLTHDREERLRRHLEQQMKLIHSTKLYSQRRKLKL